MSNSLSGYSQAQRGMANVETDMTVQAFAQWLTEMKARSSRTLQEMLSEMSIIRDGITSNNVELTDFKRHSSGISQQMQSQLTDLREKLTNAFGEITALVKQKTLADQEMMQDINSLQGNLSCKTAEIENLKRSYSQAHQQLQSSLIQITNHMSVTKNEVSTATSSCDRVQHDTSHRLGEVDSNLRGLEEMLSVGNAENRNQMLQLQEEIARIHESLASVSAEFLDHKRATNSVHNKLQSQVWSLEEGRKRQQPGLEGGAKAEAPMPRQVEVIRPVEMNRPEAELPTSISTQPISAYSAQTGMASMTVPSMGAYATPPQSMSALPAFAASMSATELGGYPMLQQISPAGSAQAPELVSIRGVTVPCYMDYHLASLHPSKLREHALLLFRTLGQEAIGSAVPGQDGELIEWISRIHKLHVEPLRASSAMAAMAARSTATLGPTEMMSASVLPTQQNIMYAPGTVMPSVQGTRALVTPGLPTRPGVMMAARQPVTMMQQMR